MHYTLAVFHEKDQNVEDLIEKYKYREEKNANYYVCSWDEAITFINKYYGDFGFESDVDRVSAFCGLDDWIDDHGDIYSTRNPQVRYYDHLMSAKLHWNNKETYSVKVGDVDDWDLFTSLNHSFPPYAVVTPDGKWHEMCNVIKLISPQVHADEILDWIHHFQERFIDNLNPDLQLSMFYYCDEDDEHYMTNLIKEAMGIEDSAMFIYHPATIEPR